MLFYGLGIFFAQIQNSDSFPKKFLNLISHCFYCSYLIFSCLQQLEN